MKKITKLKKAAREVKYEIDMFNKLSTSFNPNLNIFSKNVLTESFAVHAYCLFRFFYQGEIEVKNKTRKRKNPDDIIAEDFEINRSQFRKNRTPKECLKNIEKKRNKQIAHLTYNRIYRNSKTKDWKVGVIIKGLQKTIIAFINSLPDEYKSFFN
ncbi:MAG: hypothetical protein WC430_02530 [Patescibacteria group bacterium]